MLPKKGEKKWNCEYHIHFVEEKSRAWILPVFKSATPWRMNKIEVLLKWTLCSVTHQCKICIANQPFLSEKLHFCYDPFNSVWGRRNETVDGYWLKQCRKICYSQLTHMWLLIKYVFWNNTEEKKNVDRK